MKFICFIFVNYLLTLQAFSMACLEEHANLPNEINQLAGRLRNYMTTTHAAINHQDAQLQNFVSSERLNELRRYNCIELSREETNLTNIGSVGYSVQQILQQRFYIGLRMQKCVATMLLADLTTPLAQWDIAHLQKNLRSLRIFNLLRPYNLEHLRERNTSLAQSQAVIPRLRTNLQSALSQCVRPVTNWETLPSEITSATSPPTPDCEETNAETSEDSQTAISPRTHIRRLNARQERLLAQRARRQEEYQRQVEANNAPAVLREESVIENEIRGAIQFANNNNGRLPRGFDPILARMELEAVRSTPPTTQGEWDEAKERWRKNLNRYRRIARGNGSPDERRSRLTNEVWNDYLAIYRGKEASAQSVLEGLGGNCQSRVHILTGLLQMFPELVGSDQRPGVQVYANHVETVIIPNDRSNNSTLILRKNGTRDEGDVPVFSPLADLNGLLRERPIPDSELLLRGDASMLATTIDNNLRTENNELFAPNMRHNQHWPAVNSNIHHNGAAPTIAYDPPPEIGAARILPGGDQETPARPAASPRNINPDDITDIKLRNIYTDENQELLPSLRLFIENNPNATLDQYISHFIQNEINVISLSQLSNMRDSLTEIDNSIIFNCEIALQNGRNCMESPGFVRYMDELNRHFNRFRANDAALQFAIDEQNQIRRNIISGNSGQTTVEEINRSRAASQQLMNNQHVSFAPEQITDAATTLQGLGVPDANNPFLQMTQYLLDENNLNYIPTEAMENNNSNRAGNNDVSQSRQLARARNINHNLEARAITNIYSYNEFLFQTLYNNNLSQEQRQNITTRYLATSYEIPNLAPDIAMDPYLTICGDIQIQRYQAFRLVDPEVNLARVIICPEGHQSGKTPAEEFQAVFNLTNSN